MDAKLPSEVPNPTPAPPKPMIEKSVEIDEDESGANSGEGTTSPDDDIYDDYGNDNEPNSQYGPSKGHHSGGYHMNGNNKRRHKMTMDEDDSSNEQNYINRIVDVDDELAYALPQRGTRRNDNTSSGYHE